MAVAGVSATSALRSSRSPVAANAWTTSGWPALSPERVGLPLRQRDGDAGLASLAQHVAHQTARASPKRVGCSSHLPQQPATGRAVADAAKRRKPGGHTQTHAVLWGSPALDAGDNA